ncbi:hypothetical protein [Solitalea lacus]|uniref:hypothetical protein n=1 Tax=Solitalea lacus TaxID=2911172 RepID=UPI001EDB0CA3|nr:hypothetical protein [Solitalea lacus]UKJ06718.1 hypothetical protein L2B55_14415 [Solitalea lacus]
MEQQKKPSEIPIPSIQPEIKPPDNPERPGKEKQPEIIPEQEPPQTPKPEELPEPE